MSDHHPAGRRGDPIGRATTVFNLKLSWVYGVAVIFTAYEVVMRYGLSSPTIWVHDMTIALCATAFVFAGAYAMVNDQHIRITSLYDNMSPRTRALLDVLHALLTLAFLVALTYAAFFQAQRSVALMETSGRAWDVPIPAFLKSVLAAGSLLMAVLALDRLVRAVRRLGRS
ncbi:TRAP transporter small permease subunit [Stella sp.]|uniref:TRAP transporter small permease subunit n=1 Tax=Stella sp. TaxID=2912054 RepID=UPI0035B2B573